MDKVCLLFNTDTINKYNLHEMEKKLIQKTNFHELQIVKEFKKNSGKSRNPSMTSSAGKSRNPSMTSSAGKSHLRFIFDLYLIITIPKQFLKKMNDYKPEEKIKSLNQTEEITSFFFIFFKGKGKEELKELRGIIYENEVKLVIENLNKFFLKENKFWISINIAKNNLQNGIIPNNFIKSLVDFGFGSPYMCEKSPLGVKLSKGDLCLFYKSSKHPNEEYNNIFYVIEQYQIRNEKCFMYCKFDPKTIKELLSLPNNKREIAGELSIAGNFREGKGREGKGREGKERIVFIISIISNSTIEGQDENVTVENKRYNFHSHPVDAYVKYNAKFAWPSFQDYLGFLKAVVEVKCIFHVVSTVEGVYIISIAKEYVRNLEKLLSETEFIKIKYDISGEYNSDSISDINVYKKVTSSPVEYTSYVNSELKFFNVNFFEWNRVNSTWKVFFPKTKTEFGENCEIN
jgi:hypothetical protein